jgi:hypothetical protein
MVVTEPFLLLPDQTAALVAELSCRSMTPQPAGTAAVPDFGGRWPTIRCLGQGRRMGENEIVMLWAHLA